MRAWRSFAGALLLACALPASAASVDDPAVLARLASCNPAVIRTAIDEMLRNPQTVHEPLVLFYAASGARMLGETEEAAFLFLAAGLRTSRQILFVSGDRGQLLMIMMWTIGPLVMPAVQSDPALAKRVVARVIDWDRATPDPFRDRPEAKGAEIAAKLAAIDANLAALPDQIAQDPEKVAQGKAAGRQAEAMLTEQRAKACGPGTIDATDLEAAKRSVVRQAEDFARSHPFVVARAGGAVKSTSVSSWTAGGPSGLPSRLSVAVTPATEARRFYAEVDAVISVTPERKLGEVKMSVACATYFSLGSRDASWRDVCQGDPQAVKP